MVIIAKITNIASSYCLSAFVHFLLPVQAFVHMNVSKRRQFDLSSIFVRVFELWLFVKIMYTLDKRPSIAVYPLLKLIFRNYGHSLFGSH